MAQLIIEAVNGAVEAQGSTIVLTPDIFGTYETVEDIILTMEAPDYSGFPGSEINSPPEPGAPIFTTGKARLIIEPYNPAEGN